MIYHKLGTVIQNSARSAREGEVPFPPHPPLAKGGDGGGLGGGFAKPPLRLSRVRQLRFKSIFREYFFDKTRYIMGKSNT